MRLIDAPIGLFEHDGVMALKTEYSTVHGETITPDCYTVDGGEYFWGGTKSVEERNDLDVKPIDAVPVRHGRWVTTLYTTTSKRGRIISNAKFCCSECGYSNGRKQSNYCPNCGAKMDLEG